MTSKDIPLPKSLTDTLIAFVTRELQQAVTGDAPATPAASGGRRGKAGAAVADSSTVLYVCNILNSFIGALPVSVVASLLQPLVDVTYGARMRLTDVSCSLRGLTLLLAVRLSSGLLYV